MRFLSHLVAALAIAPAALAVDLRKAAIVKFDDAAPDDFVKQVKDSIRTGGGIITHVYSLIKGFAVSDTPEKTLESIKAMSSGEYKVLVEEDLKVEV
ncbi:hypothetical protein DCS_06521 [Drechmeria coniospora]|uniref:Inhibitor I9 domain-containing protein n=1 Tax=Drechmeria coniospora TaxID=98403 RepID=A0A151GBY7_DRECN|nr:hypothetical protein DCS_06521 [Drechmeria coniospora]KYK54561.1 hypothetical protein DCS_06521 [Drechmeria coniospora]ODA80512.1 hypothetical protein RJ55_03471 [Drechmeria coniospora]